MNRIATHNSGNRLVGLDFARGLAILGMTVIHFRLVMAAGPGEARAWQWIFDRLDGRPATLFMVSAGIGVSLMARGAQRKELPLSRVRRTLCNRGAFLLGVGFLNLMIWPGDILRVYGVSFFLAALLIARPGRELLIATAALVAGFIVALVTWDFEANWNWETLEYRNLWTLRGAARHLLYDGFRSVLPWTGLLTLGMWLGRLRLSDLTVQRRLVVLGGTCWLMTECISALLVRAAIAEVSPQEVADVRAVLGTASLPALPLFLLSSGGCAAVMIGLSLMVCRRTEDRLPVRAMIATGQMAFTWYVGHIVLGLGTIDELELFDRPTWLAVTCGFGFFALAAALSLWWRGRERRGPLEYLLRRVCG